MEYDPRVYGYYNGKPCYSEEEFVHAKRHRGAFDSDAELIAFAEEASHGWYDAGWKHSFIGFYLSDYALSEPRASLTRKEFERLKELQAEAIAAHKAAEKARNWQKVKTLYWADNSVEEVWRDKDGNEKTVMVTGPHGDACY